MQKFRRLTFNLRVTVIFFLLEMEFPRFQFSLYVMQSEFNINCVAPPPFFFFYPDVHCLIWRKNYDPNNAKEAGDPSILSEGQPSYGRQCC